MSDDAPRPEDYEALGLADEASSDEVERAYRSLKRLYAEDQLATYALLNAEERSETMERIEAAYARLHEGARAPIASSSSSSAAPEPPSSASVDQTPLPPEPNLEAPGHYLASVRRHKGLSLEDLASRTRIGKTHLENIEGECFVDLPPTVYVRGFVMQYARELGVPRAATVVERFMALYKDARPEG